MEAGLPFLNGYVLNLCILYCTGCMRNKDCGLRFYMAALPGGAYVLMNFANPALAITFGVCLLVLELVWTFGLDGAAGTALVGMALTACFTGASAALKTLEAVRANPVLDAIVLPAVCLCLVLLGGFIPWLIKAISTACHKSSVHIVSDRGEIHLPLLKDSGNLLRDPQRKLPVMVVRAQEMLDVAPLAVLFALGLCPQADDARVYPVPYKTLGGSGVLYGFEPKACSVEGRPVRCLVALCQDTDKFGGDCSALCNPEILEG